MTMLCFYLPFSFSGVGEFLMLDELNFFAEFSYNMKHIRGGRGVGGKYGRAGR